MWGERGPPAMVGFPSAGKWTSPLRSRRTAACIDLIEKGQMDIR
jgi:hypothetical protein